MRILSFISILLLGLAANLHGQQTEFSKLTGQYLGQNTPATETCPHISPDGNYIFYVNDGMWWRSAEFIEELRPKE